MDKNEVKDETNLRILKGLKEIEDVLPTDETRKKLYEVVFVVANMSASRGAMTAASSMLKVPGGKPEYNEHKELVLALSSETEKYK